MKLLSTKLYSTSHSALVPITQEEYQDLYRLGLLGEAQEIIPLVEAFRILQDVTRVFTGDKEAAKKWWKAYLPTLDVKQFVSNYRYKTI